MESQVGRISLSGEQKLEWRLDYSHLFSVKSFYSYLAGSRFPGLEVFPSKGVWIRFVPSKICCFIWRCLAGHIATLDLLQRMGYSLANWCCLCRQQEETMHHLFLSCSFSRKIWSHFFSKLQLVSSFLTSGSCCFLAFYLVQLAVFR
ncbi:hypothetical protein LINPERHAP1_LOCUS30426 [Linum perenne]